MTKPIAYNPTVKPPEEEEVRAFAQDEIAILEFESKDESVATVDQSGRCTWVSDGTARIVVKERGGNKAEDVPVDYAVGASARTFKEFEIDSASRWAADNVTALMDGKVADANTLDIFSTMDQVTPNFIRNVNNWAYGQELTAMVAFCRVGGPWYKAGCLIDSRCVINAGHYPFGVGDHLWWVGNDNSMHDAYVTKVVNLWTMGIPNAYSNVNLDIAITILDRDVNAAITPSFLMPYDWTNYAPSVHWQDRDGFKGDYEGNGLPVYGPDRNKRLHYAEVHTMWENKLEGLYRGAQEIQSLKSPQNTFYKLGASGDSGNYRYIGTTFSSVAVMSQLSPGTGDELSPLLDTINAVLADEIPGHVVPVADLSPFNLYSPP